MRQIIVIVKSLMIGLLFVIVPFALFTLIVSKAPVMGGIRGYVVLSGSMDPTLPVGSVVYTYPPQQYLQNLISPLSDASSHAIPIYAFGDVVSYKKGDKTITHRITSGVVKDNAVFYTTKGDANAEIDPEKVQQEKIVGKVFLVVPGIGQIIQFLKRPLGFVALILIPGIILIILEGISIVNEIEKKIEKKYLSQVQQV